MELLICPADKEDKFTVSLWAIEQSADGPRAWRGPTLSWVAYSHELEKTYIVGPSILGQIDACLARGLSVRKPMNSSRTELAGLSFSPADVLPKAFRTAVLAAA